MYGQWSLLLSSLSPKVSDFFLLFLHQSNGLSVCGIEGYPSVLSCVFRFKLPESSSSSVLKDVIRSSQLQKPSHFFGASSLEIYVVLPLSLQQRQMHCITKKTIFLLSLVTAKK